MGEGSWALFLGSGREGQAPQAGLETGWVLTAAPAVAALELLRGASGSMRFHPPLAGLGPARCASLSSRSKVRLHLRAPCGNKQMLRSRPALFCLLLSDRFGFSKLTELNCFDGALLFGVGETWVSEAEGAWEAVGRRLSSLLCSAPAAAPLVCASALRLFRSGGCTLPLRLHSAWTWTAVLKNHYTLSKTRCCCKAKSQSTLLSVRFRLWCVSA